MTDAARHEESEQTTAGSYFVANYPAFSFWQQGTRDAVVRHLDRPRAVDSELGIYVHVPFCRKRCDFCYFRVYTDKNSHAVKHYIDAVLREAETAARFAAIRGRKPKFVYFGGGTPSYLSVEQLETLFTGLQKVLPWDEALEVTFECEPGTLQEKKIDALRELGVTRLSLGVENFDPEILELNNRAHRAKEIHAAYEYARAAGFPQINIDLISGMVGETDAGWQDCIAKTRALAPESVTIYQMEIPFNTTVYRRMRDGNTEIAPVADWETKRRWVDEAFAALENDGYHVGSAYTACKDDSVHFRYRDALWHGADLLGLGVSSFSHVQGMHFQNDAAFEPYCDAAHAGELPAYRSLLLNDDDRLTREFVLQLKLGHVPLAYFRDKFGVDPAERFAAALAEHRSHGYLTVDRDAVTLTRRGLLQVDRLLESFFDDRYRTVRSA
ncbi:MAG: coproporphyrinogen III oxidase family protein [Planctomycetes bacterium]|nr:coproporphyrinogen III oxidase family protein [Planctomycetota bacterium]